MLRPMDDPWMSLSPGTNWLFRRARPRPGRTDRKATRSVARARVLLSLAGRRARGIGRCLIVLIVRRAGRIPTGGAAAGIEIILGLIGGRRGRRCVRAVGARRRVSGRARSGRACRCSRRRARAARGSAGARGSSATCGTGTTGAATSSSPTARALRMDASGCRQRCQQHDGKFRRTHASSPC